MTPTEYEMLVKPEKGTGSGRTVEIVDEDGPPNYRKFKMCYKNDRIYTYFRRKYIRIK